MDRCIQCGVAMVQGEAEIRIQVGRDEFRGKVPGLVCPKCGESYVDHSEATAYELSVAQQLALNGPAKGEMFQFMRKAIGMSAVEVASLFGFTPETISRWEHDRQPINPHVFLLLGSLVLDHISNVSTTEDRLRKLIAA